MPCTHPVQEGKRASKRYLIGSIFSRGAFGGSHARLGIACTATTGSGGATYRHAAAREVRDLCVERAGGERPRQRHGAAAAVLQAAPHAPPPLGRDTAQRAVGRGELARYQQAVCRGLHLLPGCQTEVNLPRLRHSGSCGGGAVAWQAPHGYDEVGGIDSGSPLLGNHTDGCLDYKRHG